MKVIPLGPGFAAELRDVTLAEIATNDDAYQEARAAFEHHSVLVFRDQDVSDESQIAFAPIWTARGDACRVARRWN